MQWFKHDSDATTDSKLKKLIMRYGTDGYAIYFHCLELIAGDISETNITFELEHDAEIIADDLKVKGSPTQSAVDRVNEIMLYMLELGLFNSSDHHIFCYKLLKRLDCSMTSNPRLRKMIGDAKQRHDYIMIDHDQIMLEEKRIEEIRREENRKEKKQKKEYSVNFITFWNEYPRKANKGVASGAYNTVIASGLTHEEIMSRLSVYKSQIIARNIEEQYIKHPSTFLNNIEDFAGQPMETKKEAQTQSSGYRPTSALTNILGGSK